MSHRFWFAGRSYFQKIIFFMSLFSLIIFIPFAMITYKLSEKSTLDSIQASNDAILSQINYTYKYLTNSMSTICLEVFFKNDVRNMLYSREMPYNEIATSIREIEDTTLAANPSIYSISFFNKSKNVMYSTRMKSQLSEQELLGFIDAQEKIPKLKPVLRTMTTQVGNIETTSYVFSYFMFEFGDPVEDTSSFLVINQNANWFMDNIVSNVYSSNSFSSSTYLLGKDGEVYKGINSAIAPEAQKYIIDNYKMDVLANNRTDPQHYTKAYGGEKYILSSVRLGDSDNSLLIIQNYAQVFKSHIELRNNFILVGVCFFGAMIIALFLFSLKIYKPVNAFVSNLILKKGLSRGGDDLGKLNEFEYLKDMYNDVNEHNSVLQNKAATFGPIAENYQLQMLANDSNRSACEQFRADMPEHWLSREKECNLCVILFKIDRFERNKFNFEKSDLGLLLFSVQNIAEEIICDGFMYSSLKNTKNSFALIVDLSDNDTGPEEKLKESIQKAQRLVKQHLDIPITIAYSSGGHGITDLSGLFSEAREYLSYSYVSGPHSILNKDTCRINGGNLQTTWPPELDGKLAEAMRNGDLENIKIILGDIKNVISTFKRNNITICIMALVNLANKTIDDLNSQKGIVKNYGDIYQKALDAEYIDDFFDQLVKRIKECLLGEDTKSIDRKDQIFVSTVMKYVQKNYRDIDLSSASIADFLGMSSKYAMRKFKDCTKLSLNDYIISIRMKKAASLLENTDLPISRIAEEIGIENETYFYKLFKKVYDCTPREYTELNFKDD